MPYLKLVESASQRVTEVREAVVRLGRDPAATIVFTGDDARVVSARHAEIRYVGGEWRLADAGSKNGTFLNGERIGAPVPVRLGDRMMLGQGGPVLIVEGMGTSPGMPVLKPGGGRGAGPEDRHGDDRRRARQGAGGAQARPPGLDGVLPGDRGGGRRGLAPQDSLAHCALGLSSSDSRS